ncbi:glycoside hydrolase family 2 TIM barrel-domain containing protein [Seonamhaeicola maritimus]|uniref:Glycoside hydrolase family 2 n=1 Tax=Seonamhaeicola maritimus TaxID=2591822 RepID=A0A5C7GFX4_9FLAO|nr:glycoside hydrolase family 2 TIM barrel-domain containing protein [Seonamhaeicola maritimus]TXG36099.1 glycoside hydrolase family 2 [Seonamhaeicola maritimus]
MKHIYLVLISILLIGCNSKEDFSANGELSLNGTWKFHTIYGEGSNYLNIQETEKDLVIDNNHPNVEKRGKWRTVKSAARFTSFYGDDYLQHNFSITDLKGGNKADSSYVRFHPNFKKSGYYEVFTIFPFASHLTAQYNVKHTEGITTKYVSQRTYCNEWISLGVFDFNSNDKNYVELTAIVSGSVAADAVMFREISKEKYLGAKDEPKQVFKTDFDDSNWYDLKVPGHWAMNNDFSNYTGKGWYRNTIDIPQGWTNASSNRYYLKFGGVYHLSKIYLNGKFIGKNRGGFTPFEFDVTDALNFYGKNVIAVQADNTAIVGATWNWGGIIRDVALSKTKDVRIDYQYVHTEPDLKTGNAQLKLKVRIENNSSETRTITVNSKVLDENEIGSLEGTIEVEPNASEDIHLETNLSAKNVKLWHFDDPNLYKITTTISEGEALLGEMTDNFGIRKIELTDSQMLLNGEPVRLAGFNRVSESRFWGSSEPIQILEKDVDLMKEAGANFMRIMHGTQNENLIDLCDKKGILLFEEVNVRDLDNDEFRANYYPLAKFEKEAGVEINPKDEEILMLDEPYIKVTEKHNFKVSEKNYFLSKYWLKGMIERDINHPSIIGWSVGNELNNHFEYGKAAIDYVKQELDPYRLVTCVSNSGQKEEYTPETDPNTFSDLIMHNMYRWQGEPQEILTTLRTKWPNKPVFISEYGFDPFPSTEIDGDKEIFSEWMGHFKNKNEFVIGTSMWTFNDYRSGYAATTAEENRVWGIITTWRQKRRLFDRIKKEHAPIENLEILNVDFKKKSAEILIPIKSRRDYPSHSMTGYQLKYQFTDTNGDIVLNEAIDLPILRPEDNYWKGEVIWDDLPENILDLTVRLMTPTGYSRFDKTVSFQNAITPQIKELIAGKNAVRVLFDKVPNASEYFVSYKNEDGKEVQSNKTITNYIDIDSLGEGKAYSFKLYAINDRGVSNPSEEVELTTNKKILPPIIWDAFITDNKLVIGYSSDFKDGNYTVKYGTSKNNLDKEFVSNVRGMVSIDLNGNHEVFFKMNREYKGQESNWSQIVKATKTK